RLVPEISRRIVEIDRAIRWGYNFTYGPFELWDALGVADTAARIRKDGLAVPENVERMLASGARAFYTPDDCDGRPGLRYFDLEGGGYSPLEPRPGVLVLADLKRARGVVKQNAGASLVDLGDGVLCLEFHSKLNVLADDAMQMLHAGIDETARNYE